MVLHEEQFVCLQCEFRGVLQCVDPGKKTTNFMEHAFLMDHCMGNSFCWVYAVCRLLLTKPWV